MNDAGERSGIATYLVLVTLISGLFWALIIAGGHLGGADGHYVAGLMWAPAVAALLTVHIRRIDPQALGLRWGGTRDALIGYLLPLGYAAVAYAAVWALGFGSFPDPRAVAELSRKFG